MGFLLQRRAGTTKPSGTAYPRPNLRDPLVRGLKLSVGSWSGSLPHDLMGRRTWANVDASMARTNAPGVYGSAMDFSAQGAGDLGTSDHTLPAGFTTGVGTVEWILQWNSQNFRRVGGFRGESFAGHAVYVETSNLSNNRIRCRKFCGTSTATLDSTVARSDNELVHILQVSRSTTDHELYVNGFSEATSTTDVGTGTTEWGRLYIGNHFGADADTSRWFKSVYRVSFWDRALSAAEVWALWKSPNRIYAPRLVPVTVPAGAPPAAGGLASRPMLTLGVGA